MEKEKFESRKNKEKTKHKKQLPGIFKNPDGTPVFEEFTHDVEYQEGILLYVPGIKRMIVVKSMSDKTPNLIQTDNSGSIPLEDVQEPSDEQIMDWTRKQGMPETIAEKFLKKQRELIENTLR